MENKTGREIKNLICQARGKERLYEKRGNIMTLIIKSNQKFIIKIGSNQLVDMG